ncbi:hypothetical protein KVR01_006799 [Diaporthe batatas]|uniref:uncharacterized protein n=1 Tax=Diaporthe batatas TaxID=748121 RepID=UPI001D0503DF|nr:uncharacterized protein KVR01_006799 [Diaporthe batatas]KAG8163502.1 hypothetical protein KVR01_006799 [Diaporthe batatas]
MRRSRLSLRRSLLLSTTLALSFLAVGTFAQDDETTSAAATSDRTATADDTATASEAMPTIGQTSANDGESSTSTSASADTVTSDMPSLSTSTSDSGVNSDMPTISTPSGAADAAIPTYPAPSVPPTQNAPFMQVSTLPDGTVFICVGAVLGAFALALLLWRAIIACLLHRSVEKAAMAQHLGNNDKTAFPAPPAPFYKYTDQDSSQNVNSGRGVRRTTRGPVPSATPSQTNLFFSPTAGAGNRDSVYRDNGNRDSSYRDSSYNNRDSRFLPAGFYAAGAASPQNVDGHGHGHSQSISMTNLRPDSRGHPRAVSSHSPPESPGFGPQRTPLHRNNMSTSSVNLNAQPQGGRAPSAFLDDLLGENPEMFPPQGTTPEPRTGGNNANHPYRQSGRF